MALSYTNTAPNPLPAVKRQLIVFDFDWSLVDQDTDRWVHEMLNPALRAELNRRKRSEQFTDLCADLLRKLHESGATPDQIREALVQLPFHPGVKRGVQALKAAKVTAAGEELKTDFFLLSNSNRVYIETILGHHGLYGNGAENDLFDEIVTNPATFEANGLLKLERRIPASAATQHTCTVGCSPNMCKGDELDAFLARHTAQGSESHPYERIIYVGDGGNDFCPVKRLRNQDLAFVRKFRGLSNRIAREGGVKAGIKYWNGAWELEGYLNELRGLPALEY
ncbi:hypothetical protein BCV70DRAFT_58369 [Testicularia cyperi]|uniref:HAD-like protein n=1 Tax=Testicularia cyperi TaxID=1882483 RepID=A0A317XV59_9BASI|nr:hypothetical protein BCV70DRAFT_58369 [Testicularia cyperi]